MSTTGVPCATTAMRSGGSDGKRGLSSGDLCSEINYFSE